MSENTCRSGYTIDFVWTLSYPSKSWISRRIVFAGILWIAGVIIIIMGEENLIPMTGWIVQTCGVAYGLYLAQKGYINARIAHRAQIHAQKGK